MVRAAARGIIDFRYSKPFDRSWWVRLNWLLGELEEEEFRSFLKLQFDKNAAALNYMAGKKAFDLHWDQLQDLTKSWFKSTFSWVKTDDKTVEANLAELWKKVFGDPKDPEVAKRIKITEDYFKSKGKGKPTLGRRGVSCQTTL